jgi:hypothetical protein
MVAESDHTHRIKTCCLRRLRAIYRVSLSGFVVASWPLQPQRTEQRGDRNMLAERFHQQASCKQRMRCPGRQTPKTNSSCRILSRIIEKRSLLCRLFLCFRFTRHNPAFISLLKTETRRTRQESSRHQHPTFAASFVALNERVELAHKFRSLTATQKSTSRSISAAVRSSGSGKGRCL